MPARASKRGDASLTQARCSDTSSMPETRLPER